MAPQAQADKLIFSLRALVYRLRQLTKESRGYSKAKHRELAKLLREGQEGLARIKTEDAIATDNLIIALEILELHCERLHVRANILDHLVAQKAAKGRNSPKPRPAPPQKRRPPPKQDAQQKPTTPTNGGWSLAKLFGFGSSPSSSDAASRPDDRADSTEQSPEPETAEQQQEPETHEEKQERDVYIDPELDRDAAAIFYSYARIPRDIPGLLELRAKLVQRWGNDFAQKAQDGDPSIVEIPKDLIERLRIEKVPESLVENYLREIARSYKIPYHGETWESDNEDDEDSNEQGSGKVQQNKSVSPREEQFQTTHQVGAGPSRRSTSKDGLPEIDELARRFAALKK
ncbi:hypothetical protein KEM56_003517 [Ascosphaera pollenicola]|nr:hypothetical protein KEM56_003517 [Ascosphaera pollenicola]